MDELNNKNDKLISMMAAVDAVETIGFDFSDSGLSAAEIEEVCEAIGEVRQEWSRRIKRLPSAQPEPHGVCMDCLMKNVCRFKTGLGDYGYCSQWKGAEYG